MPADRDLKCEGNIVQVFGNFSAVHQQAPSHLAVVKFFYGTGADRDGLLPQAQREDGGKLAACKKTSTGYVTPCVFGKEVIAGVGRQQLRPGHRVFHRERPGHGTEVAHPGLVPQADTMGDVEVRVARRPRCRGARRSGPRWPGRQPADGPGSVRTVARSSASQAGPPMGKKESHRTSTRPALRSRRGSLRPKATSTPRSAIRERKAPFSRLASSCGAPYSSGQASGWSPGSASSTRSRPPV